MQPSVYQYLESRPDLIKFIRMNPIWYRTITRDPSVIPTMEQEAKYYFGKTASQKIERFSNQLQMVQMIMQMAKAMKD